jgi:hypothetical protein
MTKPLSIAPELSRPFPVERLEQGEHVATIVAGPEERAALARRFDLLTLERLEATVTLRRIGPGPVVRFEGRLEAELAQPCVLSLEPVEARIAERFGLTFAPEGHERLSESWSAGGEVDEDDAWPEPITDGRIDLGEAVAQQLALALDPYPRKPGITLEDVLGPAAGETARPESPFAVLSGLRAPKA